VYKTCFDHHSIRQHTQSSY